MTEKKPAATKAEAKNEKKSETAPKTGDIQLLGYVGTMMASAAALVASKKRK